ncbi:MAG: exodeoxyribonuclease VII small subunit [Gammaproteobacteria bacterium]|nr:exodeoxyribonuclease VII small subunit [Gammaproteobacteria bacterium]
MKRKNPHQFETTLAELEQVVERMERGDLPLEESLQHFERGIALARSCQQALQAAEQKVQQLSRSGRDETLVPFADVDPNPKDPA